MGKRRRAKAAALILNQIQTKGPQSEKELLILKEKEDDLKKSTIGKALQELLQQQRIAKEEENGKFGLVQQPNDNHDDSDDNCSSSSSSSSNSKINKDSLVPIAVRLRQTQKVEGDSTKTKKKKSVQFFQENDAVSEDIDDEIARLERELAQEDNDDDDSDDGDNDDECANDGNDAPQQHQESTILSLSKFSNDHVEHLPAAALPLPGKYTSDDTKKKKSSKKRKRGGDEAASSSCSSSPHKKDGLQQAVQEVLAGYQARSSEKLPFYCRFCAHQYHNEETFVQHKSTDFHQAAVQAERKSTYCKLCRLQLTSPVQMKEHLSSRPHRQRLEYMKEKNGSRGGGRGGGGGRNQRNFDNRRPGRSVQRQHPPR